MTTFRHISKRFYWCIMLRDGRTVIVRVYNPRTRVVKYYNNIGLALADARIAKRIMNQTTNKGN